jgi:hypothetical protein
MSQPNADYFAYLDTVVATAAEKGLLCALVVLWFDNTPDDNLDWAGGVPRRGPFSEEDVARFSQYLVARYEAFGVVWIVSGDSGFKSAEAVKLYDAAAESVVANAARPPLLTAHINGATMPSAELNTRHWLSFMSYQSCHFRDSPERARRYARAARSLSPVRPVLNTEPCYDSLRIMDADDAEGRTFTRSEVRRASWASVLAGATAGITYGVHGIWPWHRSENRYMHMHYGEPLDWKQAILVESADDVIRLGSFMQKLAWWQFEPIAAPPFDIERPQLVLATAALGTETIVLYLVGRTRIHFPAGLPGVLQARWCDPQTGVTETGRVEVKADGISVNPPATEEDRVLLLQGPWRAA